MFKDLCPPKVSFFQRHCPLNYKYATLALAQLVVVVSGILAKVQRCSFSPQKAAEYVMENVSPTPQGSADKDSDFVASSLKLDS